MTSGPGLESREAVVVNISTSVEDNAAKEPLGDSNIASDSFRVDFNLNQRRNSKVIISLSSISFFRSFLLGTLTTAKV